MALAAPHTAQHRPQLGWVLQEQVFVTQETASWSKYVIFRDPELSGV